MHPSWDIPGWWNMPVLVCFTVGEKDVAKRVDNSLMVLHVANREVHEGYYRGFERGWRKGIQLCTESFLSSTFKKAEAL